MCHARTLASALMIKIENCGCNASTQAKMSKRGVLAGYFCRGSVTVLDHLLQPVDILKRPIKLALKSKEL